MNQPIYDPDELGSLEPYKTTLSRLNCGKRNAVHASQLAVLLRADCRAVRRIIETLRVSGVCIISDENGYYYPATAEEIQRYIKRLKSVISVHSAAIRAAYTQLDYMLQETEGKYKNE
ncbi:MAG: hypothetical protein UH249_02500 [Acutalibacteraceae bacterium]|nr:hypothetical protein [Acutalibacteraceae bacterium]